MTKYSRVIKSRRGRRYRYNYDTSCLEWVVRENNKEDVLDSIGLSRENFESDRRHWVETYDDEITEELHFLCLEADAEMKRTQNKN